MIIVLIKGSPDNIEFAKGWPSVTAADSIIIVVSTVSVIIMAAPIITWTSSVV